MHKTVESMKDYYEKSSVLLTKAGGLTITEAAFYGIPTIITSALPGHEVTNIKIFANHSGCIKADTIDKIIGATSEILRKEDFARKLVINAKKFVNNNSTIDIINAFKEYYK